MDELIYSYDVWPEQSGKSGVISYDDLTANPVFSRGFNTRLTEHSVVTVKLEWMGLEDAFEMIVD